MKLTGRTQLIALCLFFILIYTLAYPQHAFYTDENRYFRLGNQILEGRYDEGIFHREPMLPLFISASYLAGLTIFQIKFLLPLIIGVLFLVVTYLLGKRFCKYPFIPVLVVLSLAYFWRWVPFTLVDILMGVFAGLSMLYFYRGIEANEKYLGYSMVFLSLAAITKITALLLLPVFVVYLAIIGRLGVLKTREFGRGLLIFLIIFLSAACLTYMSSGKTGLEVKAHVSDFIRYQSFYFIRLAIVPWTLLFLYGIYRTLKTRGSKEVFALTAFLMVFIIFNFISWKETRFLIFIFPLFAILVERGIRGLSRNLRYAIIILFFALSFGESMLLLNTVSYVGWGSDLAATELAGLESGSIIAIDSTVPFDSSLDSRLMKFPENFSHQWLEENEIDYMVLSIYGEIVRSPNMSCYKPKLGFIDAPFLGGGTPKNILVWWPGYEFNSELYNEINARYQPLKRIQYNDQDVFIIYEVA